MPILPACPSILNAIVRYLLLVKAKRLWLNCFMISFSERHGYKPVCRSQLHQFGEMDYRLRNAIWNFLLGNFFTVRADIFIQKSANW